jgi:hypothetical protein
MRNAAGSVARAQRRENFPAALFARDDADVFRESQIGVQPDHSGVIATSAATLWDRAKDHRARQQFCRRRGLLGR